MAVFTCSWVVVLLIKPTEQLSGALPCSGCRGVTWLLRIPHGVAGTNSTSQHRPLARWIITHTRDWIGPSTNSHFARQYRSIRSARPSLFLPRLHCDCYSGSDPGWSSVFSVWTMLHACRSPDHRLTLPLNFDCCLVFVCSILCQIKVLAFSVFVCVREYMLHIRQAYNHSY